VFKKLFVFVLLSSALSAEIEYKVHDIGTLQTHSSNALDLNNHGQILGWYNIDGSIGAKHFFVRDRNGDFHEISNSCEGMPIEWKWIKDNERVYGICNAGIRHKDGCPTLFAWDKHNGVIKLGKMPGKEISAINNKGHVLVKTVFDTSANGMSIQYPILWDNGAITKLKGIEGGLGTESIESYGFDLNDQGDVSGKCLVDLVYKNHVYKQFHAIIWKKGIPTDLHYKIPKAEMSEARVINNSNYCFLKSNSHWYLMKDGNFFQECENCQNASDAFYCDSGYCAFDLKNQNTLCILSILKENTKIAKDYGSIWMEIDYIVKINNDGEIIANGRTIFGENHAMILKQEK
jgi:uncharacterized membrane protein